MNEILVKIGVRALSGAMLLAGSVLAQAQEVPRERLVGTWVQLADGMTVDGTPFTHQYVLALRADSTWDVQIKQNGIEEKQKFWGAISDTANHGWWSSSGDTLWFTKQRWVQKPNGKVYPVSSHGITFRGEQMLLNIRAPLPEECSFGWRSVVVLERVDPSKSLPIRTLPSSTIKSADVAGRWAWSEDWDTTVIRIDTLTLHADSTFERVTISRTGSTIIVSNSSKGKWWIGAGDRLWFAIHNTRPKAGGDSVSVFGGTPVLRRGEQLILRPECEAEPEGPTKVYTRTTP